MKKPLIAIALGVILSIMLTIMSVRIERIGREMLSYGNMCGPASHADCYEPALKGGFPVAFLVDAPGISVEHQLAFGEDHFYPGAFALDLAVYFTMAMLVMWMWPRSGSRRLPQ